MKWHKTLSSEVIQNICDEFNINLADDYSNFLLSHKKLDKVIDVEVEIAGKNLQLAIEQVFNIIQLTRSLSYRRTMPSLVENEIVGIGYFLGSELLGIGVGENNFGKIYFSEVDFEDIIEIYDTFLDLYQDLSTN